MKLKDYPPDRTIKWGVGVSCLETGLSGMVQKTFGKKCSVWLDGSGLGKMHRATITMHLENLVKEGHPKYKYNRSSSEQWLKNKSRRIPK